MRIKKWMWVFLCLTCNANGAVYSGAVTTNLNAYKHKRMAFDLLKIKQGKNISDGVFICDASTPKKIGYYGRDFNSCCFWVEEKGAYNLSIKKTISKFLPGCKITNVIFDRERREFEIYYQTDVEEK